MKGGLMGAADLAKGIALTLASTLGVETKGYQCHVYWR
jgi:hypothetical protein